MMNLIDSNSILNRVTMYRLVVYVLVMLLGVGLVFSILRILPYDPFALLFMIGFLVAACWISNAIFAWAFGVAANVESAYITALILALIITPLSGTQDLWFIGWAAVLAMASKYIVAIHKKHLFNPVAFGVAVTALVLNQTASWWVGDAPMLPFVIVGGLLIMRKIRRFDLVASFFFSALVTVIVFTLLNGGNVITALQFVALYSPLFFFAFIILTEPLTTPPTQKLQIIYGLIVGFLFVPQFHIGSFYLTPELAMLIGNVFSFIVSPKTKLILRLRDKLQLAPDVYEFVFAPTQKFVFEPGQYMEWTLGHPDADSRGNRRYFTLASAPTEDTLRLGVKFYPNSSSYKQTLLDMDSDDEIVAAQVAGDFTLPDDMRQKCVLIAGGIGITPFRSMIRYLLDTHLKRPLVVLYSNRTVNDIVYRDVLDRAQRELGIKVVYTITDTKGFPASWKGRVGRIDAAMIQQEVPDYHHCLYYISGSNAMVASTRETLRQLGIRPDHIKTDYFAGLA